MIQIMITHLWNAYVEIIQFSYYSDRAILSYKESARFTGTTLVYDKKGNVTCSLFPNKVSTMLDRSDNAVLIWFMKWQKHTLVEHAKLSINSLSENIRHP